MISFIIPYRSDGTRERERSFKAVHRALVRDWPDAEILVTDVGGGVFDRAGSRNLGAFQATNDTFVFLDADSWVSDKQLYDVIRRCNDGWIPMWGFPFDVYYSLTQLGTVEFYAESDTPEYEYVFPGPDPFDMPASVGGCVVVRREAFDMVRGYDERFKGWGGEDRAFALALGTLCGAEYRAPGPIFHLWHHAPNQGRFGHSNWQYNQELVWQYQDCFGRPDDMRALVAQH